MAGKSQAPIAASSQTLTRRLRDCREKAAIAILLVAAAHGFKWLKSAMIQPCRGPEAGGGRDAGVTKEVKAHVTTRASSNSSTRKNVRDVETPWHRRKPPFYSHRNRKMSRRKLAAKRTKRPSFQPDFHDLEKRMMPATFVVLNTADSGAGSLRQAILDSNAAPGLNTIDFSIGAVGSQQSFLPTSQFPHVTNPVVIDGRSQGGVGYAGAPLIVIDVYLAGPVVLGAGSDGSTIRGLVLNDESVSAIDLVSNNNLVQGCYIGTNATGTSTVGSFSTEGVRILESSNNTIGGVALGDGNVISGNVYNIDINGVAGTASGNVVEGNRIGTNAAGSAVIGGSYGVYLADATDSTIGGTAPGAGNLIAGGNTSARGVEIFGSTGWVTWSRATTSELTLPARIYLGMTWE